MGVSSHQIQEDLATNPVAMKQEPAGARMEPESQKPCSISFSFASNSTWNGVNNSMEVD
jgi:hypothetical protein